MNRFIPVTTLLAMLLAGSVAQAVVVTLGNDAPGFDDGDVPTTPELAAAQSGSPAPFDTGLGNDVLASIGDFSASWTFSYVAPADPISSASLTIGIADHDSAAAGSQLSSFVIDGNGLTAELDALFEAAGGAGDGEYRVYALDLPGSLFADLADGSASVALGLTGPGLVTPLFPLPGPNPPEPTDTNGAHLVFARLEVEAVPEPTLMLLCTLALLGTGVALRADGRR
jgi:hypothetical protein